MELLNKTYENVRMATWAIDTMITDINDQSLEDLLRKQNQIYLNFASEIENLAKKYNMELSDINIIEKGMSWLGIKKNFIFDKSSSNIAQKLIMGTTLGITQIITAIREYSEDQKEVLDIATKIKQSEEEFVESLKEFL